MTFGLCGSKPGFDALAGVYATRLADGYAAVASFHVSGTPGVDTTEQVEAKLADILLDAYRMGA